MAPSLEPDIQRIFGRQAQDRTLEGADLRNASLERVCLRDWKCTGVILANSNLFRADLHGAKLERADLRAAELSGADLGEAVLTDADLEGANLRLASLADATLRGANLKWSQLSAANLRGADLTGVLLQGAVADTATVWPDGFDPAAAGVWMTGE